MSSKWNCIEFILSLFSNRCYIWPAFRVVAVEAKKSESFRLRSNCNETSRNKLTRTHTHRHPFYICAILIISMIGCNCSLYLWADTFYIHTMYGKAVAFIYSRMGVLHRALAYFSIPHNAHHLFIYLHLKFINVSSSLTLGLLFSFLLFFCSRFTANEHSL